MRGGEGSGVLAFQLKNPSPGWSGNWKPNTKMESAWVYYALYVIICFPSLLWFHYVPVFQIVSSGKRSGVGFGRGESYIVKRSDLVGSWAR